MSAPKDTIWTIEAHTLAKHEILRRYLSAWFPILLSKFNHINYIDGFSGPGRYKGGEDGSPIIALKEAEKYSENIGDKKIQFLFLDERADRIMHLEQELARLQIPKNFDVQIGNDLFEEKIRAILDYSDSKNTQLNPTFAFIDPFGFKDIPFELIGRLLQNPRTEVFITFMNRDMNRFLEHPNEKVTDQIVKCFGTHEVLNIPQKSANRIHSLRLLYQKQLGQFAKFIRFFEMTDERNQPIYDLFFATNNALGHVKMKDAFWKVDSQSGFKFSDATIPEQMVLLQIDGADKLSLILQEKFKGRTLGVKEIQEFVENETPFLETHMKSALRELENNQQIIVKATKSDGTKRQKNSFPKEATVIFEVQQKKEKGYVQNSFF